MAPDPPEDDEYDDLLKRRLRDICLDQALFADVVFEVDDGACTAHKAMLTARCDVMKAMFSGDFRESQAKIVSLNWYFKNELSYFFVFFRSNFRVLENILSINCCVFFILMMYRLYPQQDV